MHNVRKDSKKPESEAERDDKLKKIAKYVKLSTAALEGNRANALTAEGYEITGKLIELNPDFYTLWNYRRNIVNSFFVARPEEKAALCLKELELTERALKRNPKSYCAWHHRLWTVEQDTSDLRREIDLCTKFLALDARNFHCWDYRGHIIRRFPAPERAVLIRSEFEYTGAKINENFSNYSAWHYRSVFLPLLDAGAQDADRWAQLDKEFELVKQAFYTEPEDQSAWLYHRWLVSRCAALAGFSSNGASSGGEAMDRPGVHGLFAPLRIAPSADPSACQPARVQPARVLAVVKREIDMCAELLGLEPNCKMALLTSATLMHTLARVCACVATSPLVAPDPQVAELAARAPQEIAAVLKRLSALDPLRARFYEDMLSKLQQ